MVDLADIRRLIEIAERHQLEGLSYAEGEAEVELAQVVPRSEAEARGPLPRAMRDESELVPSGLIALRSPLTGVFYRAANPGDPPFVHEGDAVEEETPVGLIEAMKIFNEITAGVEGRLVRVVAQNEQLVVTGEVLMEFAPPGEEET